MSLRPMTDDRLISYTSIFITRSMILSQKRENEFHAREIYSDPSMISSVFFSGGSQSVASYEDLSSSSFSSASRASLDARSSPTPSYGAENMMVFPGDSSGSI